MCSSDLSIVCFSASHPQACTSFPSPNHVIHVLPSLSLSSTLQLHESSPSFQHHIFSDLTLHVPLYLRASPPTAPSLHPSIPPSVCQNPSRVDRKTYLPLGSTSHTNLHAHSVCVLVCSRPCLPVCEKAREERPLQIHARACVRSVERWFVCVCVCVTSSL